MLKTIRSQICIIIGISLILNIKSEEKKCSSKVWTRMNIRRDHMPFFFASNEKWRRRCLKDDECPFKEEAAENATRCWGYERHCLNKNRLFLPLCPDDSHGWV